LIGKDGVTRLDVSVEASGFSRKMAKELEAYMKAVGVDGDGDPEAARGDEESGEEDEDEEGEEDPEDGEQTQDAEKTEETAEGESSVLPQDEGKDISLAKLQISDQT
jgi:RIO kinase 2